MPDLASKDNPNVLAQISIIQAPTVCCLGKGYRMYDFICLGGVPKGFVERGLFLLSNIHNLILKYRVCFCSFLFLWRGQCFFIYSTNSKENFFNFVSNSYALRIRIPVSKPRSRTLELPLLVMSGCFLVLSPGRKRPVFAVSPTLIQERGFLIS